MQKREWENPALWSVMDRAGGKPVDRRAYEASLRNDQCAYCGDTAGSADIVHIEPRKGNGANTWHNLTAACPRCNSSKNKSLFVLPSFTFIVQYFYSYH